LWSVARQIWPRGPKQQKLYRYIILPFDRSEVFAQDQAQEGQQREQAHRACSWSHAVSIPHTQKAHTRPRTPSEQGTHEPGTRTLLLRGSIRVSLRRNRTLPAHNNKTKHTGQGTLGSASMQYTTRPHSGRATEVGSGGRNGRVHTYRQYKQVPEGPATCARPHHARGSPEGHAVEGALVEDRQAARRGAGRRHVAAHTPRRARLSPYPLERTGSSCVPATFQHA